MAQLIKRNLKRKQSRSFYGSTMAMIILCVIAGFMVLPIVYTVMQSLKPIEEFFIYPPRFFVRRPTLDN